MIIITTILLIVATLIIGVVVTIEKSKEQRHKDYTLTQTRLRQLKRNEEYKKFQLQYLIERLEATDAVFREPEETNKDNTSLFFPHPRESQLTLDVRAYIHALDITSYNWINWTEGKWLLGTIDYNEIKEEEIDNDDYSAEEIAYELKLREFKAANPPYTGDYTEQSVETIHKLLYRIIRSDRFIEGNLVEYLREGIILKLLKALKNVQLD